MSRIDTQVFSSLPKTEQDAITVFLAQVSKAAIPAQRQVAARMRGAQIDGSPMKIGGVALSNSAVSYIAGAIEASTGRDR